MSTSSFRPVLDWLPDETLYSLASRLHVLWGERSASATTSLLFDHDRTGAAHDFPSRLDHFSRQTHGLLGGAASIAADRTLLRFYRPFVAPAVANEIATGMRGESSAHLKYRLGVLTSRFRANHPLKACLACMKADRESSGWAHWHLQHQYPGVWICANHAQLLAVSTARSDGVGRFLWTLPRGEALASPCVSEPSADTLSRLSRLSSCTTQIVHMNGVGIERMRLGVKHHMAQRGWVTPMGNVRLREAAESLLQFTSGLRAIPELACLPQNSLQAGEQLGRLIRGLRSGTHPLRYLVLVTWLHADSPDIMEHIANDEVARPSSPVNHVADPDCASKIRSTRREAVALAQTGLAARAISRQLGVDTKTVIVWATQAGVSIKRRTKTLVPALRQRIESLLLEGLPAADVAERCGVSSSSVNVCLYSNPTLYNQVREGKNSIARSAAREHWLLALLNSEGVTAARRSVPGAYAWLRRNDIEWLRVSAQNAPEPASSKRDRSAPWQQRDATYCALIEAAVNELTAAHSKVTLQGICKKVPALWPKLSKLGRLPDTQRILRSVSSRAGRSQ